MRSVGHTKPIAAHCFCAVAFQGGVASLVFLNRRFCIGVSQPAFLHRHCCMAAFLLYASFFSLINNIRHRTTALAICERKIAFFVRFYQQLLPDGPPASNKPHPAEKSTPVWLAIWRTWAGFTNSQLRRAAFRCIYSYICTHPRYCHLEPLLRHSKSFGPSAPIAYATSVSPPNKAAAWQWAQVSDG